MVLLGIDPGSRRIGYGVIQKNSSRLGLLEAGLLPIRSGDDFGALLEAKRGFIALIRRFSPQAVAFEKLFFGKNQKTALHVAQVRGSLLLASLEKGLPVYEYAPNEIKAGITGYGLADKKALLKMVRVILNEPSLTVIDDASDAIAIALFTAQRMGVDKVSSSSILLHN